MPKGIVRTDLNATGISYRNGIPIDTTTLVFGTEITLPHTFGIDIPVSDTILVENDVTWLPSPDHFGNIIT